MDEIKRLRTATGKALSIHNWDEVGSGMSPAARDYIRAARPRLIIQILDRLSELEKKCLGGTV